MTNIPNTTIPSSSGGGIFSSILNFFTNPIGGGGGSSVVSPLSFLGTLGIDINAFLGNTIGQVLSDGFTCWNSTFTPSQVKAELEAIHAPYFQQLFADFPNITSQPILQEKLNFLSEAVSTNVAMYTYIQTSANWRSCSQKALKHYLTFVTKLEEQFNLLIVSIKVNYTLTNEMLTKNPSRWDYQGFNHQWQETTPTNYKKYTLRQKNILGTLGLGNKLQLASFSPIIFIIFIGIIGGNIYKNYKSKKKLTSNLLRLK